MCNAGNDPWNLFSKEKGVNQGRVHISLNSLNIEYQASDKNDGIDGIDGSVGSGSCDIPR